MTQVRNLAKVHMSRDGSPLCQAPRPLYQPTKLSDKWHDVTCMRCRHYRPPSEICQVCYPYICSCQEHA